MLQLKVDHNEWNGILNNVKFHILEGIVNYFKFENYAVIHENKYPLTFHTLKLKIIITLALMRFFYNFYQGLIITVNVTLPVK